MDGTCSKEAIYCSLNDKKDIHIGNDNVPALRFSSAAASGSDEHILIKNEGYMIDLRKHSSGIGDFPDDIYNQVLSTFKIIEKGESDIQTGKGELDRGVDVAALQKEIAEGDQSWRIRLAGGCHGDCDSYDEDLKNAGPLPLRLQPEMVLKEVGVSFGFTKEDLEKSVGDWIKIGERGVGEILWPLRVSLSGKMKI